MSVSPVPHVPGCSFFRASCRSATTFTCPSTTHAYVEADLAMKERTLQKLDPPSTRPLRFRADDRLLAFLNGLYFYVGGGSGDGGTVHPVDKQVRP